METVKELGSLNSNLVNRNPPNLIQGIVIDHPGFIGRGLGKHDAQGANMPFLESFTLKIGIISKELLGHFMLSKSVPDRRSCSKWHPKRIIFQHVFQISFSERDQSVHICLPKYDTSCSQDVVFAHILLK